jgi:hypothetical protein
LSSTSVWWELRHLPLGFGSLEPVRKLASSRLSA